ncbi:MAG: glycosyltransferase [Vulcanimicrobiota bacterium]
MRFKTLIHFGNSRWRRTQPRNSAQQLSSSALRLGLRVLHLEPDCKAPGRLHCVSRFRLLSAREPEIVLREFLPDWKVNPSDTLVMVSYATPLSARLLDWFARRGFATVFRLVDHFREDPELGPFSAQAQHQLCQQAALVTLSHPGLRRLLGCRRPALELPNGLDVGHFGRSRDRRPKQMTLTFWGTFWGGRLDWPLLSGLALRRPDWRFCMIGEGRYLPKGVVLPDNVHLLGPRHPAQLADYGERSHVGLIPFRQDQDFARYSNPIKALEYLSTGCPVLSPPNPSLENYPGVFFYSSLAEAEAQVLNASRFRLSARQVQELRREHSWDRRFRQLLEEFGDER